MPIFQKKIKLNDFAVLCNQFYVMLNSGMPLVRSLEVLEAQTKNKTLSRSLGNLLDQVSRGNSLGEAMEADSKVFPEIMCNMVKIGEKSGNLDSSFEKLQVHYEQEDIISSQIKGAMIYPIVLIIISVTAVVFLLTFVMPTITSMFTDSGTELPLPTRIVMGISDAIKNYWYIMIGTVGISTFTIKRFVKTTVGKHMKDTLLLKLPVIGKNINIVVTSRYTRTMSTLLNSGVPIVESIELSIKIANNSVLSEKMEYVLINVQKGVMLGSLLGQINFFPSMMVSMVEIGEESGQLEEMLEKTASYYDKELSKSLKALVSLIEPVAIVFMGVTIGGIVVAMMLPMFDMFKTIG